MVSVQGRQSDYENFINCEQHDQQVTSSGNNTNIRTEELSQVLEFRKSLEARDGLQVPLNNDELLRFLRAGAFELEKGTLLFEKTEKFNKENDDLLGISFSQCEHVYAQNVFHILRKRDGEGRKIILIKAQNWNPDLANLDVTMMAAWYLVDEMLYSVETQECGVCLILDLTGVGMATAARFVSYFTVKQVQRLVCFYQGGYPIKVKSIQGVNTPFIVSSTFSTVKYLLKKKLRDRIQIHYQGPKSIHKVFPVDILPESLLGTLAEEDAFDKELMKSVYRRHKF